MTDQSGERMQVPDQYIIKNKPRTGNEDPLEALAGGIQPIEGFEVHPVTDEQVEQAFDSIQPNAQTGEPDISPETAKTLTNANLEQVAKAMQAASAKNMQQPTLYRQITLGELVLNSIGEGGINQYFKPRGTSGRQPGGNPGGGETPPPAAPQGQAPSGR